MFVFTYNVYFVYRSIQYLQNAKPLKRYSKTSSAKKSKSFSFIYTSLTYISSHSSTVSLIAGDERDSAVCFQLVYLIIMTCDCPDNETNVTKLMSQWMSFTSRPMSAVDKEIVSTSCVLIDTLFVRGPAGP